MKDGVSKSHDWVIEYVHLNPHMQDHGVWSASRDFPSRYSMENAVALVQQGNEKSKNGAMLAYRARHVPTGALLVVA